MCKTYETIVYSIIFVNCQIRGNSSTLTIMKRYFPDCLSFFFITICAAFFFWRFFFPVPQLLVTPDFGRSDAWHFSFPTKYFLSQSLKKNELPLWSSKLGGGFPIFAEGQTGTFFLPNLILYKFFDPVTAYNLSLMFVVITIGWGMYVWLRILNLSPLPSLFGGLTMAFSGPVMSQLTHITLLQGFSLLPWVMIATHLLAQKKSWRWVSVLALVVSQQIFAGFPQASVITVLFASGYFLYCSSPAKRDENYFKPTCRQARLLANHSKNISTLLATMMRFFIAVALAIGLSSVQLLPSLEFLQNSTARGGFSPQDATYFSYPLKHLVTFIDPFRLGNPKFGTYPPFSAFDGSIFWENTGFIGILPLISLVAYFISSFWQSASPDRIGASWRSSPESPQDPGQARMTTFFLAALFISLFLMLGSHSPLYIVYSMWPFNLFRVPSRFLWVFVISLIILSSMGMQLLTRRGLTRVALILIIGFHVFFLMKTWEGYHAIQPAKNWFAAPAITKFLMPNKNVYTIGSEFTHNQTFLTKGWQNMRPYEALRSTLAPDSNLLWNIPSAQVYAGRFLRRQALVDTLLSQLIPIENNQATVSAQTKKFLDMFSVQQIVSAVPLTQEGLTATGSIADGGITIRVYTNEKSVPRVYLARDTVVAQTFEEAVRKIQEKTFIPGKSILVEQPESTGDPVQHGMTEQQDDGMVAIVNESDTNITLAVTKNPSRALLVLADTFYPGWKAFIDGKPTDVFPVNIRQRGVIVSPGDHTVVFKFTPQSLRIGAFIGLSTVFFIGVGFLLSFATARTRPKASAPLLDRQRNHDT